MMLLGRKFLHRFTQPELVAITASTDPLVKGYVEALALNMAREVDLSDPVFASGLNYLVSVGLLTPDRPGALLSANVNTQQSIT